MQRACLAAAALLAACLGTQPAAAAPPRTPTCVSVEAPAAQKDGLTRLVRAELDAHPSHRAVDEDCDSMLVVEWVAIPGQGSWLTGRINDQVPHREPLTQSNVAQAVERLLQVLLHNDPVRLRKPTEASWYQNKTRELARGHLLLEGGLAQGTLLLDRIQFLPGLFVGARREGDTLQLGGRLQATFGQSETDERLHAVYRAHLSVDAMFWSAPEQVSSWFGGPLLGYELVAFEGPASLLEGTPPTRYVHQSPLVGARAGFEALRHTRTRVLFALELTLPVLPARDVENGVIHRWVPSASFSAGAAF